MPKSKNALGAYGAWKLKPRTAITTGRSDFRCADVLTLVEKGDMAAAVAALSGSYAEISDKLGRALNKGQREIRQAQYAA